MAKVTLWLRSDGSSRVHVVYPQRQLKDHGTWWIKEPNIHCVKFSQQQRKVCRRVGSVEKRAEGHSAIVKGNTWTITKIKDKRDVSDDPYQLFVEQTQEDIAKKLEKMQEETAKEINKQLPKRLDQLTTLQTAHSSGSALIYNYQLDLKQGEYDSVMLTQLKSQIKKDACKRFVIYIKLGAKYIYSYVGSDGIKITEFTFGKGECGF